MRRSIRNISFNTQPPEGGWTGVLDVVEALIKFQHTAARRRLVSSRVRTSCSVLFQHTAARRRLDGQVNGVFTGSMFQHTAARRRLEGRVIEIDCEMLFQHTAARRRLEAWVHRLVQCPHVSTHSRPKAAGASLKSLAPSGFAALISLGSQEKREREYNTAFSVTPAFTIS